MDFFRSILAEDSDPPVPEEPHVEEEDDDDNSNDDQSPPSEELTSIPSSSDGGGWSFGGLIKTISTRSESVLETYRRDLREFGSGLKNETALIRDAASRAVKELPASIEVAKGSVGTVGYAIDEVLKSTAEIISHGKDALLASSDVESDTSGTPNYSSQSFNSRPYSRFDAQLRAIQSDASTYCEEPENLDDYSEWKLGFVLEEKSEEIDNLMEENGVMEGIYNRIVPTTIDDETFWCRYFYRVHKLKQQEDLRANLVKRAISADDDELPAWDVDDEIENEEVHGSSKASTLENKEFDVEQVNLVVEDNSAAEESQVEISKVVDAKERNESDVVDVGNSAEMSSTSVISEELQPEQASELKEDELVTKSIEKLESDGKVDHGESCKDSDVSVVSSQPSMPEEEDLGWDQIEDLGSDNEKKGTDGGSPNRGDIRKRLTVAVEEDEDLNWDIEDDEEPVKA